MRSIIVATALVTAFSTSVVRADDTTLPAGATPQKAASAGAADVAKGDAFATVTRSQDEDPKVVNDVSLNGGGLFAQGNARSVAVTVGSKARIRRDEHQFSAALVANYARAGKPGESVVPTAQNVQGLLRYDFYLLQDWSLFLQTSGRHDPFQGLAFRWNLDPGVAHYFVDSKTHRLWAELGYDFQYDTRTQEAQIGQRFGSDTPPDPTKAESPTKVWHSARSFAGYENKLNALVSFATSLEYLQSLQDSDAARLNFDIGVKAQVMNRLSIATTYTMRFDNKPLKSVQYNSDSVAAVNLVYSLF